MSKTQIAARSTTIWGRPHSNFTALRLGSSELRKLLSRELDKANVILDEWDVVRTRGKTFHGHREKAQAKT
jgi:hypothetical protein